MNFNKIKCTPNGASTLVRASLVKLKNILNVYITLRLTNLVDLWLLGPFKGHMTYPPLKLIRHFVSTRNEKSMKKNR